MSILCKVDMLHGLVKSMVYGVIGQLLYRPQDCLENSLLISLRLTRSACIWRSLLPYLGKIMDDFSRSYSTYYSSRLTYLPV
jgi:hypothetical protein